ncbi:MAG: dethiobiotin synthase [Rhodospirillaceae bacterium TMED8]|nr:dethiobiotin synthase [Magnetovibrio sp.]OUT50773.1 MAG: dethiobiotin synthase [Rhodospirillaceae bacterium TMED8]
MTGIFITASGTEVGKTYVTAAMIRGVLLKGGSPRALKPIITGFSPETMMTSDSAILLNTLGQIPCIETIGIISPWRFGPPLSPDMAAAFEGEEINHRAVIAHSLGGLEDTAKTTLIEGIGGVMVPLNKTTTVLDWIEALKIPAILVVGSYLGTISHTLTAINALKSRDIPINGIVISESEESPVPPELTKTSILNFTLDINVLTLKRGQPDDETCILLSDLITLD